MTILNDNGSFRNENGSVSLSQKTGRWHFEREGDISIHVGVTGKTAHVGIYGDPAGLLQLADLLTAVARLDQQQIPDRNGPPDEGIHTTLQPESLLTSSSVSLNVGRLDAKTTGDKTWMLSHDQDACQSPLNKAVPGHRTPESCSRKPSHQTDHVFFSLRVKAYQNSCWTRVSVTPSPTC